MNQRKVCPMLEDIIKDIKETITANHLSSMSRDECIEEECMHFETCWVDTHGDRFESSNEHYTDGSSTDDI